MEKERMLISIFLVFVVASGVIAYLYIYPRGPEASNNLESRVNDLESGINELESRVNDLNSTVNDLEGRVDNLEIRASEQLLIVGNQLTYLYDSVPHSISFMMMHIGTAEVTISEIRVDNVLNSSSPGWVGNETLLPGQMGQITLYGLNYFADGFADGDSYKFRFVTARGSSFYCVVRYEGWTITPTEKLEITGLTWNGNNATFAVRNTGTVDLTIAEVRVNDEYGTMDPPSVTLYPGDETTIIVSKAEGFTSGVEYEFSFILASGNRFFYVGTAP